MTSKILKRVSDPTFWKELTTIPEAQDTLSKEISIMVRSMIFSLPTSRETDALPDLKMIAEQLMTLLSEDKFLEFFDCIHTDERLMRLFFEELFGGVVGAVYRGKLYHEKKIVNFANAIFCFLVEICTKLLHRHPQGEHQCVLALLSKIIDKRVDYYKNTGRETLSTHPFGEVLKPSPEHKVWVQETLSTGDLVDALRSTQGHKIWAKAIFTSTNLNSTFCRVKYLPDGQEGYLHNKFLDIAPRDTLSQDYEWRSQIKEGDFVDIFTISKKWVLAKVREVRREIVYIDVSDSGGKLFGKKQREKIFGTENQNKKKRVANEDDSDRTESEDETTIQTEAITLVVSRRSPDFKVGIETEVNPFTAAVAPPGLFSQRTSSTDDSDDLFFRKFDPSKVAIVRTSLSFQTSSTLFIRYINKFAENGGLERMQNFLSAGQLDLEVLVGYSRILTNITNFLVHDVVLERGPALLKSMIHFALLCTSENLRDTSQDQLQTLIDAIEALSLRLMSRSASQRVQNLIMLKVFLICLKSDILDKQNFALKIFTRIERNVSNNFQSSNSRGHVLKEENEQLADFQEQEELRRASEIKFLRTHVDTFVNSTQLEKELMKACDFDLRSHQKNPTQSNSDNVIDLSKAVLGSILGNAGVFQKVIKGHASLIQKSDSIMKLLFDTGQISPKELRQLWDLIQKAEVDTRSSLLNLLKDCVWQISEDYIHQFLNMFISLMQNNQLPNDCMNLVLEMRRVAHSKYKNRDISQQVNDILWGLINQENTHSEVFKRALDSLISFACSESGTEDCDRLFNQTIQQIFNGERILVSLKILTKIFKESKLENFYIGELIKSGIPKFLANHILQEKTIRESSKEASNAKVKDEPYYSLLKKTLEFLEKLLPFDGYTKQIHQDPLFLIWCHFLQSSQNQIRESEIINSYAQSYLQEKWGGIQVKATQSFLNSQLPFLELSECPAFFYTVKELFIYLNRKAGLLQAESIVMEGSYMNDYQSKTLRFHVIVHSFSELLLGNRFMDLYFQTQNKLLENELCGFLSELLVKPRFASTSYDNLYLKEQEKLVQQLAQAYQERQENDLLIQTNEEETKLENTTIEDKIKKLNPEFIRRTKLVMLVDKVLGRVEMAGPGSLVSISSLNEGTSLVLFFEKESKYSHKTTNKVTANNWETLYDLRVKISKEFSVQPDCVGLRKKSDFSELGLQFNNKTLLQLELKTGDHFEFYEIEAPESPEEKLIDINYNFTPKALVVFTEVFNDFSTNGKMSRKQLAEFTSKATDFNHCSENDDRVSHFFEQFGNETKEWIPKEGFFKFYLNASMTKKSTVYDNLRSLGYGRDLRPKYAPENEVSSKNHESLRFKIVKSSRGLIAKILDDYQMFKTFLLKILRTLKQREQENAQSESSEARKISFLYVNWARNTKTFLMTLPPSPDVIQRILFTGFSNRDGLTPESEIEYYELQVLFALLFKRKKIQKIMRILSEQSEEPTVTSNDDISPRKETPNNPNTPVRKPWDSSLEEQPTALNTNITSPREEKEAETLLTCDLFNPESTGSLLEQMKTWVDFNTSAKYLISNFVKRFFQTDFFWFVKNAFGPASQSKKIRLMMIRLIERGLLLLRCADNTEDALNLGILIQYTRIKKLEKEKARKEAKKAEQKEKNQTAEKKTEKKSQNNSEKKDSSSQTEQKFIGPKNKETDLIAKKKRGFGSALSRNTVTFFKLEKLSRQIDFTVFKQELAKLDIENLIENIILGIIEMLESPEEDKKIDKLLINSALVSLLCLINPLQQEIENISDPTQTTSKIEGENLNETTDQVALPAKTTKNPDLIMKEQLIDNLLDETKSNFKSCVLKGLLTRKYPIVRFFFRNFYSFLLDHLTNLNHKSKFLKLLISTILSNATEDGHFLIELAGNLFTEIVESQDQSDTSQTLDINFAELFSEFAGKFESHESTEVDFDAKTDYTLTSCISFMEKIVKADKGVLDAMSESKKKKLVISLFRDCLFNVNSEGLNYSTLKCKTQASREAALSLLSTLSVGNLRFTILVFLKGLNALSKHIPDLKGNRSFPGISSYEKRSPLGYMGIKNLGCVCYMIAMLQQFFCTDTFTRGILMANDYKPTELSEVKGRQIDDNLFHQLQSLFGFLQKSRRREVDPTNFCLSYKDYDGQPVNIGVQQDSQEFLNRFFDKLETALKPTPFKGILDSVYGGKKVNVIECKGCGYVRANEELFYNLSVEAKNMNNLKQSMDKFIQPETISDFLCDNCKQKCDISKKSMLKQLPNVLIIHLQKMIFDLDFMTNIKLTHRYEFENSLNLKDYIYVEKSATEENNEETQPTQNSNTPNEDKKQTEKPENSNKDIDFEYKLVGVVIHKGTAEWGHYVSLIDANKGKSESPKWLLLDDGHVSEFKMENFKDDCFGTTGKDFGFGVSSLYEMEDAFQGANKSAYILVFDKVVKSDIRFEFNEKNIVEKDLILNNLIEKDKYKFEDNVLQTNFYNLGKYLPPKIQNDVDTDNQELLLEQQLMNTNFLSLVTDLVTGAELPSVNRDFLASYYQLALDPETDAKEIQDIQRNRNPQLPELNSTQKILIGILSKCLPEFFFKLFIHSNEKFKLTFVQRIIERIFILDPEKAWQFFLTYISENQQQIFQWVVSNNEKVVRSSVAELIALSVYVVSRVYALDLKKPDDQLNQKERLIKIFIQDYLKLLGNLPNSSAYKKLHSYFYLLHRIVDRCPEVQDFLIDSPAHMDLFHFYMEKKENKSYGKESHDKAMTYLLATLAHLFERISLNQSRSGPKGRAFQNLIHILLDFSFFSKMVKEDFFSVGYQYSNILVKIGCRDQEFLSVRLAALCLDGLEKSGVNDVLPYINILKTLMSINDKHQRLRMKTIFGVECLDDSQSPGLSEVKHVYGLAKENNISRNHYHFYSPVCRTRTRSLLDFILSKKGHYKEITTVLICFLIDMIYCNDHLLLFLLQRPPPNQTRGNVLDWLYPFALDIDEGKGLSYTLMKQEIQMYYLSRFKSKIHDFILWVRLRLGITDKPNIRLFELDHLINPEKWETSGLVVNMENFPPENSAGIILQPLKNSIKRYEEEQKRLSQFAEQLKIEQSRINDQLLEQNHLKKKEFNQKMAKLDAEERELHDSLKNLNVTVSELKEEYKKSHVQESYHVVDQQSHGKKRKIPPAPPLKEHSKNKLAEISEAKENLLQSKPKDVFEHQYFSQFQWNFLENIQNRLFSYNPIYLYGHSKDHKILKSVTLTHMEEDQIGSDFTSQKVQKRLKLIIRQQNVLVRNSLPVGGQVKNLLIPSNCLHHEVYLKGNTTMGDKSFAYFVRGYTDDFDEEEEIKPLFQEHESSSGGHESPKLANSSNGGRTAGASGTGAHGRYQPDNEYRVDQAEVNEIDFGAVGQYLEGNRNNDIESNDNSNNDKGKQENNQINGNLGNSHNIDNSDIENIEENRNKKKAKNIPRSQLAAIENEQEITIIRISLSNQLDQSYFVKVEFNKWEDIEFSTQMLHRGYYETSGRRDLTWDYEDEHSAGEPDLENYIEAAQKNHSANGSKLFRRQRELSRIKMELEKNYQASDHLLWINSRKADTLVISLRKKDLGRPFGGVVMKISWIEAERSSYKSLERAINSEWNWKIVRFELPE